MNPLYAVVRGETPALKKLKPPLAWNSGFEKIEIVVRNFEARNTSSNTLKFSLKKIEARISGFEKIETTSWCFEKQSADFEKIKTAIGESEAGNAGFEKLNLS